MVKIVISKKDLERFLVEKYINLCENSNIVTSLIFDEQYNIIFEFLDVDDEIPTQKPFFCLWCENETLYNLDNCFYCEKENKEYSYQEFKDKNLNKKSKELMNK